MHQSLFQRFFSEIAAKPIDIGTKRPFNGIITPFSNFFLSCKCSYNSYCSRSVNRIILRCFDLLVDIRVIRIVPNTGWFKANLDTLTNDYDKYRVCTEKIMVDLFSVYPDISFDNNKTEKNNMDFITATS